MEKIYRTKSYGDMRLQLDTGKGKLISKGLEIKAKVDLDTGKVNLFLDSEELEVLRKIEAENN